MFIGFQQYMQTEFCDFDDPQVQELLPADVKATVMVAFTDETNINLLTITWGEGETGHFHRHEGNMAFLPASVVLAEQNDLTPGVKANYLRQVAYFLDEGIKP